MTVVIPRILLWFTLLHAVVPLVSGQDASQTYSQVVKVYDDGNFEEEVQNGMHVVNFYAPWVCIFALWLYRACISIIALDVNAVRALQAPRSCVELSSPG